MGSVCTPLQTLVVKWLGQGDPLSHKQGVLYINLMFPLALTLKNRLLLLLPKIQNFSHCFFYLTMEMLNIYNENSTLLQSQVIVLWKLGCFLRSMQY